MNTNLLKRGFTLIEVLVALVLVSLLSLLAWRALDGMARAGEITQVNEQAVQRTQIALAQWTADLNAIVDTSASTARVQALDFDGHSLRLTRSSGEQSAGVQVVAWTLRNTPEGRVWQRWAAPPVTDKNSLQTAWDGALRWGKTPLPEDDVRTVTLISVDSWHIFYYRGDAWSNPQSAVGGAGAATTTTATRLPDGVQLVLGLPAASGTSLGGKLTHYWIAPTQGATP